MTERCIVGIAELELTIHVGVHACGKQLITKCVHLCVFDAQTALGQMCTDSIP